MVWVMNNVLTAFQTFCVNVLKYGPVPNHVAIIMDGNRRYAKKANIPQALGHYKGFEKLTTCIHWCQQLGVKELTVYAFSTENFKRSTDEVEDLLQLAKEMFTTLFNEEEELMRAGIGVRVIGNLSCIDDDLRKLMEGAAVLTKDNNRIILNIAFSYVSREEITHSIRSIVHGVQEGLIAHHDISEELVSSYLYLSGNPDILIRTSGEVRLSDFLLWQISKANIYFTDILWPDLSIWNLFGILFKYQRLRGYNQGRDDKN